MDVSKVALTLIYFKYGMVTGLQIRATARAYLS